MASGEQLFEFFPSDNEPPTSNSASPNERNIHPVLEYDAAANETGQFSDCMPDNYGGGSINVYLDLSAATAITGDWDIDLQVERFGAESQDIDSDGFAAAVSLDNQTVPGVSGNVKRYGPILMTNAQFDSIAKNELFRLRVIRDATSDTAAGYMQLHYIVGFEA